MTDTAAEQPKGLLHRIFRTSLVVIPIGVLGNIVFSLLVTDQSVLRSVAGFPKDYLFLALVLAFIPWLTNSLRLLIWTHFLGYRLRLRETFQLTLVNDLGSAVSPTAVGGGFFKWGMLVQRGVTPGAAASLTTLPIIEDGIFFALAIPTAVVITASWELPVFVWVADELQSNALFAVIAFGAVAALTWAAVRLVLGGGLGSRVRRTGLNFLAGTRRKTRAMWRDARTVFSLIRDRGKWRFALSMSLTAIQWIARYSVISALVAFLGAPVQPVLFWMFQWVVFTLMAFIPTPGAAGGAEAAFLLIYSAFLPERIIGLATAGWRFLTFYLQLGLAAAIFSLLNLGNRSERDTADETAPRT
ncbi:MAG TPA: lysylphosphatidylglycerol synthase transmembrane domain-containing protein [Longimicrobiaceae bacterium]|nr:lysylphosphatidylglycerol synthase transmembrane domain-containing protein [Longimicrobiaceae bacterium]